MSGCTPAGEEVELLLGVASGFGGVGDEGQALSGEFERITDEFDVSHERVVQCLAGGAVEADVVPCPACRELRASGGDIWERSEPSPRDRSLVTVASLITSGSTEQLRGHLARAKTNGLTETELKEAIIHLAFYAGWPKAMSAITVAKEIFAS